MTSDYIAGFAQLGAATLGESGGRPMSPRVRAAWRGARISAPAFPVICAAGDNLAIHVAVAEAPSSHVLVASVGAEPERGYWGEVLTTGASDVYLVRREGKPDALIPAIADVVRSVDLEARRMTIEAMPGLLE